MRNLFIHSFLMNMAIFSNTLIYRLRCLPLVKHIIPSTLYGNEGISAFITIIMTIIKIILELSKKIFYIAIVITCIHFISGDSSDKFLTTMISLSFFGAFANNKLLVATKEKYYNVVLMRIDANKYAKMDFVREIISDYILFTLTLVIATLLMRINVLISLLLPIYIISCKIIVTYLITKSFGTKLFNILEGNVFGFIIIVLALACTLGLLFNHIYIPFSLFVIITLLFVIIAIFCFQQFMKARCFKQIYKKKITLNNIIFNLNSFTTENTKKSLNKKITYDSNFESSKTGYEYFNELFTKRHKKILTISAYRFAGFYLAIFAALILALLFFPQTISGINEMVMNRIPYFLFVMYFTNRGASVTQAMFVNCDSSMLRYRFYRRPEVILGLFKQRLKTVILVNLIPSLVIAFGLCLLLFLSGGTPNPINYVLIFLCINAMSAFFSVHYLVLYYVLQPYNINMQAKGTLYSIISTLTYFVCYALMNVELATFPFTIAVITFSILYILISLSIAYKQAYKTFKIKN